VLQSYLGIYILLKGAEVFRELKPG
jgi:hypothetical protein